MTGLLDDLSERLLTHFVGGAWRAPFSTCAVPLPGRAGVLGQVVLAGPQDLARAHTARRAVDPEDWGALDRAMHASARSLALELCQIGFPCDQRDLRKVPAHLREPIWHWKPSPAELLHAIATARLAQQVGFPPGALAVLPVAIR
ncbi:MAG: hypothetical protein ACK4HW_04720 [Roseinatronobacter sp.]